MRRKATLVGSQLSAERTPNKDTGIGTRMTLGLGLLTRMRKTIEADDDTTIGLLPPLTCPMKINSASTNFTA